MRKKSFGFGIVGTGVIAHFHARAIAAINNAYLVGVYNVNRKKADLFSSIYNCEVYETLENMVSNQAIDIVCICTPSGMHLEPALKCIKAGKHCLIEKPLEVTLERCDQLIGAAQKAGIKIGVIFPSRFYEVNQLLKQSIKENRFGTLVLGDAYVKWNRSAEYYKSGKWRGTWQYDGGGALMNQGIHTVDLLQWFMGPVKSVQAVSSNIRHRNIEVEDTVVAILKFANGALGTIECSTAVFPGSSKRNEILGTNGTVVTEENSLIMWEFEKELQDDETIRKKYFFGNTAHGGASDPAAIDIFGHQRQIEDMIHAIESDKQPFIDGTEGRKSIEIVLAIYESARTGKSVKVQNR
jgi:predicted dehydrogenase